MPKQDANHLKKLQNSIIKKSVNPKELIEKKKSSKHTTYRDKIVKMNVELQKIRNEKVFTNRKAKKYAEQNLQDDLKSFITVKGLQNKASMGTVEKQRIIQKNNGDTEPGHPNIEVRKGLTPEETTYFTKIASEIEKQKKFLPPKVLRMSYINDLNTYIIKKGIAREDIKNLNNSTLNDMLNL